MFGVAALGPGFLAKLPAMGNEFVEFLFSLPEFIFWHTGIEQGFAHTGVGAWPFGQVDDEVQLAGVGKVVKGHG